MSLIRLDAICRRRHGRRDGECARGVSLAIDAANTSPSRARRARKRRHGARLPDTPTSGSYEPNGSQRGKWTTTNWPISANAIGPSSRLQPLALSTALRNVELRLPCRVELDTRREVALGALQSVGLGDRVLHRPNEMSGGQRQRVAIARALVNQPSILLADEPTGNLDTRTGDEILELFDQLHTTGHTILVVTHEEAVARHARRIIRIRDGLVASDEHVAPSAA